MLLIKSSIARHSDQLWASHVQFLSHHFYDTLLVAFWGWAVIYYICLDVVSTPELFYLNRYFFYFAFLLLIFCCLLLYWFYSFLVCKEWEKLISSKGLQAADENDKIVDYHWKHLKHITFIHQFRSPCKHDVTK